MKDLDEDDERQPPRPSGMVERSGAPRIRPGFEGYGPAWGEQPDAPQAVRARERRKRRRDRRDPLTGRLVDLST